MFVINLYVYITNVCSIIHVLPGKVIVK